MNDLFIPLTIGQTYTVSDFYGMLCWQGVYKGILEDENVVADPAQILLFKVIKTRESQYPWAGVVAECGLGPKGINVSLTAHYYGMTSRSLKRVTRGERPEMPKWVKQE
jgi:hypothetical protein